MSIMRKVNFKNVTLFCEEMTRTLIYFTYSVGGVTVSMVAFQAVDPGSTPGRRIVFIKIWFEDIWRHLILLTCVLKGPIREF